ncbi:MAG: sialate O-acetylesterase [bacterium]
MLQRDRAVPIWGWADAGEKVTVTFAGQTKTVTADAAGTWRVQLDVMPACKQNRPLVITGITHIITIENVLVGEVWLCGGQSNMEYSLYGSLDKSVKIDQSFADPLIRHLTVPQSRCSNLPLRDISDKPISWALATPAGGVAAFSATGYFFARELARELDVPIGLISDNWGGTRIEPWICLEGFARVPELKKMTDEIVKFSGPYYAGMKAYYAEMQAWSTQAQQAIAANRTPTPAPALTEPFRRPFSSCQLYNSMIAPLVGYGMRGVIWYQGESNGDEGLEYADKTRALVEGWRHVWGQGEFPFYWVQLAACHHSDPNKPEGGDGWSRLREAQLRALSIPHTGMAVAIDIGEAENIHPKKKQDVGLRLARWALAKDYGKNVPFSGPLYQKCIIEGAKIRIIFDHADSGLMVGIKQGTEPTKVDPAGKVKWIAIAGADKKFVWADAVLDGKTLVVSSPQVPKPVVVRYAFATNPEGANLYNRDGLPASPFRTDTE